RPAARGRPWSGRRGRRRRAAGFRGSSRLLLLESSLDAAAKAVDDAPARERDEPDLLLLARLEAHGRTGGDVEMHPVPGRAIELQGPVHLEEVEVAPDLDRPIAGVADREARDRPPFVGPDRPPRLVE